MSLEQEHYFEFSDKQVSLFRAIQATEVAKKLAVRFEAPESDQENIRRSAYLDGGLDMLQYLLGFDAASLQEAEERKQELLRQQEEASSASNPNLPSF